jgi:CubicO group peptidase (beta-lactamase class C family)
VSGLQSLLDGEVEQGSYPSAAALVGDGETVRGIWTSGCRPETLFDLASLTKVLVTARLAAAALGEGLVWDRRIGEYLPDFKRTMFDEIRVRDLATHTSGLPAWRPLYAYGFGPAAYRIALARIEPESRPGAAVVYSDLGTLVFGEILQSVLSEPLDRGLDQVLHRMLGRDAAAAAGVRARFGPMPPGDNVAPTEDGNRYEKKLCESLGIEFRGFRTDVIRGEAHDGNAFYRGGVAAHAGLFGTAEDVWRLTRFWLTEHRDFWSEQTPELPESRGLFWQRKRGAGSAIDSFGNDAFGHTGFTGTSVWVDPGRDRIFVLLTNRVHPEVKPGDFHEVRRRFHRAAIDLGL